MTRIIALLVAVLATPASAAPQNCAPRPVVLERLVTGFGETRQSIGLGAQGVVIEVFASSRTGTWTITATMPDGITCLIAAGEGYEAIATAPVGDPT